MYLQKVISRKNGVKNYFFAGMLKVNDENIRIRIQDPDPYPSVKSMDPRIRIHPKMSWIRNTAIKYFFCNTVQIIIPFLLFSGWPNAVPYHTSLLVAVKGMIARWS
jgi:hypothetical protein